MFKECSSGIGIPNFSQLECLNVAKRWLYKKKSLSNFEEHHINLAFLYSYLSAKVKRLPFIPVKLVVLTLLVKIGPELPIKPQVL